MKNIWLSSLADLEHLKEIRVNRFCFVNLNEKTIRIELHGFTDNSNAGYCAVVYLKVVTSSAVKVFFLASKTKVTPLKVLSIPRLELLGCVLLAKLMKEIKEAIRSSILIDDTYCWTDSDVVLCRIKGKEKCWKPCVESRVVSLRGIVRRERWNHVAGAVNTADIPVVSWSRNVVFERVRVGNFDIEERLKQVEELVGGEAKVVGGRKGKVGKSKDDPVIRVVNAVVAEYAEFEKVESNHINENNIHKMIDITSYSRFKKLMMVTCYVLRFIKYISNKVNRIREEINADEYDIALKLWAKNEQSLLKFERNFGKLHKSLKLFNDHDKILCLKGCFENAAEMGDDEKHPIILRDSNSHFTKLLILKAHEDVLHYGIEFTLNKIRSKFWIVRGRKTVRSFLRKCVICKRYQGNTLVPPEYPGLRKFRIECSHAYQVIGLDYAGPFFIKNSNMDAPSKAYILLLTCTSSRTIHPELVHHMKAPAFTRAFKRFIARCGMPGIVISDNFKTFKSIKVKRFMTHKNITQKFILPAAP